MMARQKGGILPFPFPAKLLAHEQNWSENISTGGSEALVFWCAAILG